MTLYSDRSGKGWSLMLLVAIILSTGNTMAASACQTLLAAGRGDTSSPPPTTMREFASLDLLRALSEREPVREMTRALGRQIANRDHGPLILEKPLSVIGQFRQKDSVLSIEIMIVQELRSPNDELEIGQRPKGLSLKFSEFLAALSGVALNEAQSREGLREIHIVADEIANPVITRMAQKMGATPDPQNPARYILALSAR
jgi:hypothetical protein